jgi:hypothetical protein
MTAGAPEKIVMLRGVDRELWAAVRDQAKHDGMYLRPWIEQALRHELDHRKKFQQLLEKHRPKKEQE